MLGLHVELLDVLAEGAPRVWVRFTKGEALDGQPDHIMHLLPRSLRPSPGYAAHVMLPYEELHVLGGDVIRGKQQEDVATEASDGGELIDDSDSRTIMRYDGTLLIIDEHPHKHPTPAAPFLYSRRQSR